MSEEVTSNTNKFNIKGVDRKFRTITTHENNQVQKVIIQENVTEEQYDEFRKSNPDIIPGEVEIGTNGSRFYINRATRTNSGDGKYTTSDFNADFEFDVAISESGPGSLLYKLTTGSVVALSNSTGDLEESWKESFPGQFENQEPVPTDFAIGNSPDFQIKPRENTKLVYEDLTYPEDISQSGQDVMRFSMFRQTGRSFSFDFASGNLFTFGTRVKSHIGGSVTLPIQTDIQDTNQVDYQRGNLNPVTGALASISADPLNAAKSLTDLLSMKPEEIQQALGSQPSQNVVNALKVFLAQTATNSQGLIPRTTGAILNPNVELLLQAPQLRSFRFSFRMSARSSTEATQIKKIIRFFKQGMSVKTSDTSLFLVTPNLFKIRYLANGINSTDHPSIGRIKDCALTSLNTQYTPDGTYMTYDDPERTMTSYNITMEFTELEPIFESDYTGGTGPLANSDEVIFPIPESHIGY